MRGNIDYSNANAPIARVIDRLESLNISISRHYNNAELVALLRDDKRAVEQELEKLEAELEKLRQNINDG